MPGAGAAVRLTLAQVRWLQDPRLYSHPWRDRTFRALLDKGAVVKNADYDYSTGRCGYEITALGRATLERRGITIPKPLRRNADRTIRRASRERDA